MDKAQSEHPDVYSSLPSNYLFISQFHYVHEPDVNRIHMYDGSVLERPGDEKTITMKTNKLLSIVQ